MPFSKKNCRKLAERAEQHNRSPQLHRMAYQKDNHLVNDIEVELARQQIRHDDTTTAMVKKLISAALYMFVNAVSHTTQRAELLSLLALVAPKVKAWLCGLPAICHQQQSLSC